MNDLQALKCMNEQPERNVRLDGEAPPSPHPPQSRSLANLWLQSSPMHPPRHIKLLLSGFLTPRAFTRDQFRLLIAPRSSIRGRIGEFSDSVHFLGRAFGIFNGERRAKHSAVRFDLCTKLYAFFSLQFIVEYRISEWR